jgi:hexosaminidase
VPPQLDSIQAKHILGAQANVWTEYIPTSDHVEYMVYPRACAMAEVLWSKPETKKYEDFKLRMKEHADRLTDWKVNFARHILKDDQNSGTSTK